MSDVDAVFAALSDPTRRLVLDEVGRRGDATATELAADLPVTRQAVAKHLAVLAQARLVDARRAGRETRYRVTPAPLNDAIGWMARVGGEWDERLARLQRLTARGRADGAGGARPGAGGLYTSGAA
ncbi:MAG: helix-turn-helix transcriptional regulator, partial [Solirubrobacteraceae bacterium]|nr:helix-turn-helix transcriptional regulator [Solirubrobacteraceae bacterium]